MKNNQSSGSMPKKNEESSKQMLEDVTQSLSLQETIDALTKKIMLLSYEESLRSLDQLLENLQSDNLPVEDMQKYYLQGKLYLDHCESLLNNVEQEVIELNPDNLKEYSEE